MLLSFVHRRLTYCSSQSSTLISPQYPGLGMVATMLDPCPEVQCSQVHRNTGLNAINDASVFPPSSQTLPLLPFRHIPPKDPSIPE
jgi:hypothetical protein